MEPLGQSTFSGAFNGLADGVNEELNVNKITKLVNTYPCSPHRSITKITIDDMEFQLGGFSMVKATYEFKTYTGATHHIDPNYG